MRETFRPPQFIGVTTLHVYAMLPNTDSLGVTTKLNYGDMELQYDSPFPSVSPTLGTIEFSKTAQEIFCEGEPILGSPSLVPADVFPPLGDLGACDDDSGVNNANKENQQPNMARHGPQSSFIPGGIINRRAFSCSPSREHSLLLTADDSAEYSPLVEAGLFESAEKCEKELRPTSDSANWSGSSADGRVDVGKSEHQNSEDLHGTRQKDAEMNDKNRDRENNSLSCFQVSTAPRFDKSDLPFQDNKDVEVTEVPVQTHLQTDTYEAEVMKPPGTLPEPAEAIQAPFEPNGTNFISVSEHMTQSELSPHLKVNSQSISHSQQNRVDQFRFLAQSEMVTEPSQFTQDVPYRPQDQSNLNRISLCSEDEKQNRKRGTRRDKGRPPNPPSRRRKPNGTGFIVAATAKKEEHHQEPDPGTLPSTGGTSPASTTPSAQTILPTSDSRQGPCEARHSTQKARKNIAVPSEIAASDHHLDNLSRTAPASSGTSYLTKPAPAPATKGATSTTSKRRGKPRNVSQNFSANIKLSGILADSSH